MPVSIGGRLGPYEILSPIGAGGMGEVWLARDTRLNRTVALKVSQVEFSERFAREARAVAALNHPNICQLYDVGPNYLVMEFVEGETLKGPLPLPRAIEYAAQILDALDAAHKKGIIHRDLKPANILVTRPQRAGRGPQPAQATRRTSPRSRLRFAGVYLRSTASNCSTSASPNNSPRSRKTAPR
jgi:eukaryotic-like serine/threonine-protein kinase